MVMDLSSLTIHPVPVHRHSLIPRMSRCHLFISLRTWAVFDVTHMVRTFQVPILMLYFCPKAKDKHYCYKTLKWVLHNMGPLNFKWKVQMYWGPKHYSTYLSNCLILLLTPLIVILITFFIYICSLPDLLCMQKFSVSVCLHMAFHLDIKGWSPQAKECKLRH